MRVLVTGGAGYIGSVITDQLIADGHSVVVYDNLSKGHRTRSHAEATLVEADLLADDTLKATLAEHRIEAVIHMAASSLVGESMTDPGRYYLNNVVASTRLLNALVQAKIQMLVFSSTAAVYGEPKRQPIAEDDATAPSNTYGETKLAVERAMHWYNAAHGFAVRVTSLFQRGGRDQRRGERHDPETHLIPLVLRAAQDARYPIRYSATTTRRATARASGITCTCRIWHARTCWPSTRSRAGTSAHKSSISGAVMATR